MIWWSVTLQIHSIIINHNSQGYCPPTICARVLILSKLLQDTIGMTYFFAVYNFLAFLNSFVNPFILLMTGNIFRRELAKVSTRLRKKYTWFRITSNKSAGAARNNVNNKCNRKCSLQVPLPVTHINSSGVASDNSFVKAESYGWE